MKFMDLLIVACGDKAYVARAELGAAAPEDLMEIAYEGEDKKFGEVVDKVCVTDDDAFCRWLSNIHCIFTVEKVWNLQRKST